MKHSEVYFQFSYMYRKHYKLNGILHRRLVLLGTTTDRKRETTSPDRFVAWTLYFHESKHIQSILVTNKSNSYYFMSLLNDTNNHHQNLLQILWHLWEYHVINIKIRYYIRKKGKINKQYRGIMMMMMMIVAL